MTGDSILLERVGNVATITINRPERYNALDDRAYVGLRKSWEEVRGDASVRAVVVTGAGDRAFCTGMDLAENAARGKPRDTARASFLATEASRASATQNHMWKPVVAAVNGVTAGAGLLLLADADYIVASDTATFLDGHTNSGQLAALEPIALLARIGLGNVLRLVTLGRAGKIDAAEALRIGLVTEVVAPDRLQERAAEIARAATAVSPATAAASKRALFAALELPRSIALQNGWEMIRRHWSHPDAVEGPKAFAEKREPVWSDEDSHA
jgi:E-phenylitaconyl-CoA hydratase